MLTKVEKEEFYGSKKQYVFYWIFRMSYNTISFNIT